MHGELISWVMGFYVVNDVTANCKNVQLHDVSNVQSAEATENYCRYHNIGAISKLSQNIK